MEDIKNRLIMAIVDYWNSNATSDFKAEDMADHLIETIEELNVKSLDVNLDTYNNLMICPHCNEIIGTAYDWTPNYCKKCGKPLSGGNQQPLEEVFEGKVII